MNLGLGPKWAGSGGWWGGRTTPFGSRLVSLFLKERLFELASDMGLQPSLSSLK